MHRSVRVACLPKDIPDDIQVDITEMMISQVLHLKDVPMPVGIRFLDELDIPLAQVLSLKQVEAAAAPEILVGNVIRAVGRQAAVIQDVGYRQRQGGIGRNS